VNIKVSDVTRDNRKGFLSQAQWLKPIILVTRKTEIRRIIV
jgi:hypothetical protein